MKKKVLIIISIIILIIIALWFTGVIPKQIGKIYGTKYMKDNFPKMQLEYANIEWNKYYGDYIITFKDKENKSYGCVISPKYFPVALGQGLFEIQETYRENYEIENEPNKEPSEMRPPELYIHLENSQERIKAITGTFSWKENDLAVTADSAHPTVLEYQQENTIKYNGSKIIIENDSLKISAVNIYSLVSYDILAKEIHFDDNVIGISNLEMGEYALEIIADYPQGRVSYGVKISNNPELKVDENTITSKGAKFTITNTLDEEYNYGADYRIDKKINNEWKAIETEYPLTWNALAYRLKANSSNEIIIDWSIGYGELETGEYRVAKTVFKSSDPSEKNEIYAEFEIK